MNFKSLSSAEMIHISAEMVTPRRKAHTALMALPSTAGLVPLVATAHEALEAIEGRTGNGAREAQLKALSDRCVELDRDHDAYVRRIFGVCTALSDASQSPEQAEAYLEAGRAVFPAGFAAAQASYKDEAGQATLVDQRLTDVHLATLASISTPDGTLADDVARWKKIAKELGRTETERTRLAATPAESKGTDAVAARNAWIAAVSALTTVFELSAPSAETRADVLGPLEAETAKARRPKAAAPEKAPEGEPGPTD
jgi:hypothetical protein